MKCECEFSDEEYYVCDEEFYCWCSRSRSLFWFGFMYFDVDFLFIDFELGMVEYGVYFLYVNLVCFYDFYGMVMGLVVVVVGYEFVVEEG